MSVRLSIPVEEAEAVVAYAAEKGEGWKNDLRLDWLRSARPGALQSLRNRRGPHWLRMVCLKDLVRALENEKARGEPEA